MAELSFEDFDRWCDDRGIKPDDPRIPLAFAEYLEDALGRPIECSPIEKDDIPIWEERRNRGGCLGFLLAVVAFWVLVYFGIRYFI